MTEHIIKLRGGWSITGIGSDQEPEARLTLPSNSLRPRSAGYVLRRPFHAPRSLDPGESVWLRIQNVPGVCRIVLNDRVLHEGPIADRLPREFHVTADMTGRCLLTLELGGGEWIGPAEGWGHVALLIRARGPGEGIGEA